MLGLRSTFVATGFLVVASTPAQAAPSFDCTAALVVNEPRLLGTPGLAVLDIDAGYVVPDVEILGSGADVHCELGPSVAAVGAQATFSDDDMGSLNVRFDADSGVPAVQFAVAICSLAAVEEPVAADFSVSVNEAKFPDGSSTGFTPRVSVGDVTCGAGQTTTTSTSTSTTSTTVRPSCADLDASGTVTAPDCLMILRSAVGIDVCSPACVCDPDGNDSITASDGLLCLRSAIGLPAELSCPCS